MSESGLEAFVKLLITRVRDSAVRTCDSLLEPTAISPKSQKWRTLDASPEAIRNLIPDIVDSVISELLFTVDEGIMRLKYVGPDGQEVDLHEEGNEEMVGWYMGRGGWRAQYCSERFFDYYGPVEVK